MTTTHEEAVDDVSRVQRWRATLAAPVDIAVLVYFRIAFGAIMVWEMWRFVDQGWIDRYYTDKDFYFKYWPFEWVQPFPEPWIHLVFWATAAAAAMVASGFLYRIAAPAMFLGLGYIFLLERARYLNHFYLIVLIAFLMCFLPLNRAGSIDARRRPELHTETVPAWTLWLLRFQVAVPYVFGGIAKLNEDWLRGEPLRAWLAARTDFPVIGRFFTDEPVVWAMTYGALLLDLFVVVGLLYRRTRPWAFLAAVVFHLMNSRLFGIGIFPWTMMAATAIFFEPSWPRHVLADLRARDVTSRVRVAGLAAGAGIGFLLGGFLPTSFSPWRAGIGAMAVGVGAYHVVAQFRPIAGDEAADEAAVRRDRGSRRRPALVPVATFSLLAAWVAIQVLVPLRHYVTPGNVHWTEEGHDFSWHMKLRDKDADAVFYVGADGDVFEIDTDDYLNSRQESKMESRPHLMVQFAHHLEDEFEALGYSNVEVYVDAFASLNGRDPQRFIDPTFDLTSTETPWWGHADWILPLDPPEYADGDL